MEVIICGVVSLVRLSEVGPQRKETLQDVFVPRLVKFPLSLAELLVIVSAVTVATAGGYSLVQVIKLV